MSPVNEAVGRHRVDRETAEILAAAGRVEALVRLFPGDEFAEIRSSLLAFSAWLAGLAEVRPVPQPGDRLRMVGLRTVEGIERMNHNRGRQR